MDGRERQREKKKRERRREIERDRVGRRRIKKEWRDVTAET